MNAVILLVWLAGADPAPQTSPAQGQAAPGYQGKPTQVQTAPGYQGKPTTIHPTPAPVVVNGHGSCNTCGDCCDHGGHKLFGRLRGMFHRSCDDGCKDCGSHPSFHRRHQDNCCNDCGGGHKLFGFLHRGHNDCCDDGGHKLFGRFHNIFRRHDDCCKPDCCNGAAPAVIHPHPAPGGPGKPPVGEKIGAPKDPKKMPSSEKKPEPISPPPGGLTIDAPTLNPGR